MPREAPRGTHADGRHGGKQEEGGTHTNKAHHGRRQRKKEKAYVPLVQQARKGNASAQWHGSLGNADWPLPRVVAACQEEARPGYDSCSYVQHPSIISAQRRAEARMWCYTCFSATEYCDSPTVLSEKVDLLVRMLQQAKACVIYTGAGISTSAGIGDYASKARGTRAGKVRTGMNRKMAEPTLSHRVLTALHKKGCVHEWVNQNHDGLAQKAGFPLSCLNEIHGSWFDSRNRVLMMDDALRPDLLRRLVAWEAKADLCLAMGTSLCGMTADCVATTVGEAAQRAGAGTQLGVDGVPLGLVIINLQQTKQDAKASLRMFATTDTVMAMVRKRMRLRLAKDTLPQSRWVK